MVGIVGIGACIGQELALLRSDLVRSLVNSGTWARVDAYFKAQLELWRRVHKELGFYAFQQTVVLASFAPTFYRGSASCGNRKNTEEKILQYLARFFIKPLNHLNEQTYCHILSAHSGDYQHVTDRCAFS